jgi:hypothetical protein
MADPPMAAGLVQYRVESCVSVLIKSESFRVTLCGKMDERVVNWDGGGEVGCNDDFSDLTCTSPPVKCG